MTNAAGRDPGRLSVDHSPLGAAATGGPRAWHWAAGFTAAFVLHAVGATVGLAPPPPPPPSEEILEMLPIDLGPPAAPGGRVEDFEPPPPEPEPEPEPDPEPEPRPEVPTERAPDAPPPAPTPPPPPRPPQPEGPPRLSSGAPTPGAPATGFGVGGELSLSEFQLVAAYIDRAARPFITELRYPNEAARRRLEGSGALYVRVDRSGQIIEIRIHASTGERVLDGELERVSRRVRRLDPLPESFPRETLAFLVPVQFQLIEQ